MGPAQGAHPQTVQRIRVVGDWSSRLRAQTRSAVSGALLLRRPKVSTPRGYIRRGLSDRPYLGGTP
jgi:hypothetical protein